jgi:hypothetical protein
MSQIFSIINEYKKIIVPNLIIFLGQHQYRSLYVNVVPKKKIINLINLSLNLNLKKNNIKINKLIEERDQNLGHSILLFCKLRRSCILLAKIYYLP